MSLPKTLSRRDTLLGATAAGAVAFLRRASVAAAPSQPATPLTFEVPPGACDCHTHIFGDERRFPFAPERTYTPEAASVDELRMLHRALHIDRVVVVQPSVYAADNGCTVEAIRLLGARARGVAVINDRTTDSALDAMGRAGICGVRINLETAGQTDPAVARERMRAAVRRVQRWDWHIQIFTRLAVIEGIKDEVMAAQVPIVFDHFGGAQASLGVHQAGFDTLINLVRSGKAYVKISGAYRASTRGPDYPDATGLATALVAANPERVLWGTDWPHPDSARVPGRKPSDVAPLLQIDDGRVMNQLAVWVPDAALRKTILVDNPARLYRF